MGKRKVSASPVAPEAVRTKQLAVDAMFHKQSETNKEAVQERAKAANAVRETSSREMENFWDSNLKTILSGKAEEYDSKFLDDCGNVARMGMVPTQNIFETIIKIMLQDNKDEGLSQKAFSLMQVMHTLFPPVSTSEEDGKPVLTVDRAAWTPIDHGKGARDDDDDVMGSQGAFAPTGRKGEQRLLSQLLKAVRKAAWAPAGRAAGGAAAGAALGSMLMLRHTVDVLQDDLAQRAAAFKAHGVRELLESSLLHQMVSSLPPAGLESLAILVENLLLLVAAAVEQPEEAGLLARPAAEALMAQEMEAAKRSAAVLVNALLELYALLEPPEAHTAVNRRSDATNSWRKDLIRRVAETYINLPKLAATAEKVHGNDDIYGSYAAFWSALALPDHKLQVIGKVMVDLLKSKDRTMKEHAISLHELHSQGFTASVAASDVLAMFLVDKEIGQCITAFGGVDKIALLCAHAVQAGVALLWGAGGMSGRATPYLRDMQEKLGQVVGALEGTGGNKRLSIGGANRTRSLDGESLAALAAAEGSLAAALEAVS